MDNKFTNAAYAVIVAATLSEAIFPDVELINDYHLRVNLLIMDRDEEKLFELNQQLNDLVEGKTYELHSAAYMKELERITTEAEYYSERQKKAAEIEVLVDGLTGEKNFTIRRNGKDVKKFVFGKNEMVDPFFDYLQDFSRVITV